MKNIFSVAVSGIGFIAIAMTLFIWYWLATVGIFIGMGGHSYGILWVAGVFGLFPGIVGIGVLKRREWARRFLMGFWFTVIFCIIFTLLQGLDDLSYDPDWFSNVVPWYVIVAICLCQVLFLRCQRVKELFE